MSGKLDQSLDDIMKDTKPTGGRRGGRSFRPRSSRRAATKAKAAIAAPTGGVQKNTKAAPKPTASMLTAPTSGESKIIVSGLPDDVTEVQIKDYFGKMIGTTKKVFLTYGPNGRSRGVATIVFSDPKAASKAAAQLDGVKVDNRAMKIEVVLGAKQAPQPAAPKSLADRVAKPKNAASDKPKPATGPKASRGATNGTDKSKPGRNKKTGRGGKPKKKTAEELDAEMVDYFGVGEGGAAAGTTQAPVANGDTGMVDEVM